MAHSVTMAAPVTTALSLTWAPLRTSAHPRMRASPKTPLSANAGVGADVDTVRYECGQCDETAAVGVDPVSLAVVEDQLLLLRLSHRTALSGWSWLRESGNSARRASECSSNVLATEDVRT